MTYTFTSSTLSVESTLFEALLVSFFKKLTPLRFVLGNTFLLAPCYGVEPQGSVISLLASSVPGKFLDSWNVAYSCI